MRKSFFLSILAVGALVAGCAKSEVVDSKYGNDAIGFESYIGRDAMTKATVADKDNLTTIGLYGFYTGASEYKSETTKANLWANLKLTKEESAWTYPSDQTKYWTNATDNYTFLAYAPYNASAPSALNEATTSVPFAVNDNVANQDDFVYANDASHVNMVRPGEGATHEPVGLIFKHALSRITVKASENVTTYAYTIKSIKLRGDFNVSGNFTLSTGEWSDEVSATKEYDFYSGTDVLTATATEYKSNGYLMVIPTTFGSDSKLSVAVTYSTTFGEGADAVTSNDVTKVVDMEGTFAQGKAYAINLTFEENKDNPISFTVDTVVGWDPETSEPLVPENGLNPEKGVVEE